jgi:hypothetical protein
MAKLRNFRDNLPCVRIGGVGILEVTRADVTFLVAPASPWPASPYTRGFWVVIFDLRARVREDFDSDISPYLGI